MNFLFPLRLAEITHPLDENTAVSPSLPCLTQSPTITRILIARARQFLEINRSCLDAGSRDRRFEHDFLKLHLTSHSQHLLCKLQVSPPRFTGNPSLAGKCLPLTVRKKLSSVRSDPGLFLLLQKSKYKPLWVLAYGVLSQIEK